jgi:hypothetical protein
MPAIAGANFRVCRKRSAAGSVNAGRLIAGDQMGPVISAKLFRPETPHGYLSVRDSRTPRRRRSNAFRSKRRPSRTTPAIRLVLLMSRSGSPSVSTRFAVFPASIVPSWSAKPRKTAASDVAARRTCAGVKPASTRRASSSCRLRPGAVPFSSRKLLWSVPARIGTPLWRICFAKLLQFRNPVQIHNLKVVYLDLLQM